jgi:hypothetical protein
MRLNDTPALIPDTAAMTVVGGRNAACDKQADRTAGGSPGDDCDGDVRAGHAAAREVAA